MLCWRIGSDLSHTVIPPAHVRVMSAAATIQAMRFSTVLYACRDKRLYLLRGLALRSRISSRTWATKKRPHAVCGKSTLEQEFLSTVRLKRMGKEANGHL